MEIRSLLSLIFILFFFLVVGARHFLKRKLLSPTFITRTAIFASIAIILYIVPFFNISLPFFPAFLNIHVDEIPAFISGFLYGPFSGILVIFIKTIAKLPLTTTGCVGELADFIYSLSFLLPASIVYKKVNCTKGMVLGLLLGTISQLICSSFITSFLMLDFYIFIMNLPKEAIISMCKAINPRVDSLGFTFLFFVALPFNAFKDLIVIAVTFVVHKKMHPILKGR